MHLFGNHKPWTSTRVINLGLILLAAGFWGCRSSNIHSETKIDSGIYIDPGMANTVPAVHSIGGCSSTSVSDTTLVTAGHCVFGYRNDQYGRRQGYQAQRVCLFDHVTGENTGVCTSKIFYPEEWKDEDFDVDVAVAVFEPGTFKHYFPMSPTSVQVGDTVTLAGYSKFYAPENRANGTKRWGQTTVAKLEPGGVIISYYRGNASGVAVSPGDSGGPLFKGCQLAGVASRMATLNYKWSLHTNLATSRNAQWLKGLRAEGAEFCGLPGADPSHCAASGMAKPIANLENNAVESKTFPCVPGGAINTPETPITSKVYLALDQNKTLFISIPEATENLMVCYQANANGCSINEIPHTLIEKRQGRAIYKTTEPLTITASEARAIGVRATSSSNDQALVRRVNIAPKPGS